MDLLLLAIPMHYWKDLLIDFVTSLPVFNNMKGLINNSIVAIVDRLTEIVYYKLVKV